MPDKYAKSALLPKATLVGRILPSNLKLYAILKQRDIDLAWKAEGQTLDRFNHVRDVLVRCWKVTQDEREFYKSRIKVTIQNNQHPKRKAITATPPIA